MEVIMRKVSELTPYAQNTKKHDQKQINNVANSIKRFGWQQPIVIDENGVVVIGHCRLLAAKKLKQDEVPCTVASGLTEEEVRELRIADNKTNESLWDMEMLEMELPELDFDGFDFDFDDLFEEEHKATDWFETRERYEEDEGTDEEYSEFLEKFEPKKTTDDCYTPDNVYDAVANWVADEYGLNRESFVRPFYPGGDYQKYKYKNGCVVVDNPPFSIMAEIIRFYSTNGIRFFLFAPALTLFSARDVDVTYITTGSPIVYENGAVVSTSFITNLDMYRIRTAPELFEAIDKVNRQNLRKSNKELAVYSYPEHVVTSAMAQKWSKYGVDYHLEKEHCVAVSALDSQKEQGKSIYGGGFLISYPAAAEKAAAEKAAAEQKEINVWGLSERELKMIAELGERKEQEEEGSVYE